MSKLDGRLTLRPWRYQVPIWSVNLTYPCREHIEHPDGLHSLESRGIVPQCKHFEEGGTPWAPLVTPVAVSTADAS